MIGVCVAFCFCVFMLGQQHEAPYMYVREYLSHESYMYHKLNHFSLEYGIYVWPFHVFFSTMPGKEGWGRKEGWKEGGGALALVVVF